MFESLGKHWTKGIIFGAVLVILFIILKPVSSIYTNLTLSILSFAGISSVYQIFKALLLVASRTSYGRAVSMLSTWGSW